MHPVEMHTELYLVQKLYEKKKKKKKLIPFQLISVSCQPRSSRGNAYIIPATTG
jgi:hypothetical protein